MHLENEHFIDHTGENLGRFASILHEYPQTCAVVNIASVPLRLHSQSSANASQHYLSLSFIASRWVSNTNSTGIQYSIWTSGLEI